MREIRPYGSEGGGAGTTGSPYPYDKTARIALSWSCVSFV